MKNAERERPPYAIESVDNALRLLLLFRTQPFVRVSEASDALGVARSTAHRLLAMLQYHGFVDQDPEMRVYRPGPTLVDTGLAAIREMDIRRVALPIIEQLRRDLDETVHVAIRDGDSILFLAGAESARPLRAGDRTGTRLPLHCTAAGKAILSRMSDDDVRRILPKRLPGITPASITSWPELETELEKVRAAGFATNFGESEADLVALGAPVVDRSGRVRGSIVVTAPAVRGNAAWVAAVAPTAIATADAVAAELG
jgi:DNA-binding IclR family transcriptional regulator